MPLQRSCDGIHNGNGTNRHVLYPWRHPCLRLRAAMRADVTGAWRMDRQYLRTIAVYPSTWTTLLTVAIVEMLFVLWFDPSILLVATLAVVGVVLFIIWPLTFLPARTFGHHCALRLQRRAGTHRLPHPSAAGTEPRGAARCHRRISADVHGLPDRDNAAARAAGCALASPARPRPILALHPGGYGQLSTIRSPPEWYE